MGSDKIDYKKLFLDSIKKFPNAEKWVGAEFAGIKTASNTSVGNIGEDFVLNYSKSLGFDAVISDTRTSWDIKINGICYELKTATEDVHEKFQFNHFRTHRKYDAAICLGVSPNDLFFCVLTKSELLQKPLVSMEKGANASYKWTLPRSELWPIKKFKQMMEEFTNEFNENKERQEIFQRRRKVIADRNEDSD